MAGMTGASSNIGCLETLPVARCWTECPRSTRLGSVRLYTRGCIQCILWCNTRAHIQFKIQWCNILWRIQGGSISGQQHFLLLYTVGDKPQLIVAHVTPLALHLSEKERGACPVNFFTSYDNKDSPAFPLKHRPLGDVLYQGLGQAINPDQQPQLGSLYPHFSFNIRRPRPAGEVYNIACGMWIRLH